MKRLPLWPSHADRWLNCAGAPRVLIAALQTPRESSVFAEEGTLAHAILAYYLTPRSKCTTPVMFLDDDLKKKYEASPWHEWLPAEDLEVVRAAVDEIELLASLSGYNVEVEQFINWRVDQHQFHCRVDVLLINDESICIVDYKHGAGKRVDVRDNPQLLIYACAARAQYPGRVVSVGILQPRGQGDGFTMQTISDATLDTWELTIAEGVRRAYNPPPVGIDRYTPGPWCHWCDGMRGYCPRMLEWAIDAAVSRDEPQDIAQPAWLIGETGDNLIEYIKGINKEAFDRLASGGSVPGWMLVEEPGRRKWYNPDEVAPVLAELLGGKAEQYRIVKTAPITITAADKLARKAKVDLSSLIERPTRRVLMPAVELDLPVSDNAEMGSVEDM